METGPGGRGVSRRAACALIGGAAAAALVSPSAFADTPAMLARPIPGSGELLPAVGLGTAYVYDDDTERSRRAARQVVDSLLAGGGRLIDTASSYGDAESVLGAVLAEAAVRERVFLASKLEAPDAAELKRSLARLKTAKLDLLQLHNVSDAGQSLARFRDWKAQGLCRYIGITSTFHGDFAAMEAVLRREKPDFLQIDYSLDDREAEKRLLPLALEVKAAVLTATPFGHNRLFRAVRGKALPPWAADFGATSWAQFFLKFLLGNPAVTAVIPGTADATHMADNLGAGRGRLPDAAERRRMVELAAGL